jgi:hypothetical protein
MRKEQRAALGHALDALGDGSGHEVWGPGVIGRKLIEGNHPLAARAFDAAAWTLFNQLNYGTRGKVEKAAFIAGMRKLAPVLFDILLPPEL